MPNSPWLLKPVTHPRSETFLLGPSIFQLSRNVLAMQVLVQHVARNYVGLEKDPAASQRGGPHSPRPCSSPFQSTPSRIGTGLRQRSLGRSNINFPSGSSSTLLGLRAQRPSRDQGCEPPPPATVLLRAPPPLGQPRAPSFPSPARHLFTSARQGPIPRPRKNLQTERTPGTPVTALRSGLVAPLPGVCKRGSAPPSQPEVLRSFSKSPKMCPSTSRRACSSPGLAHTLSPPDS